MARYTITFIVEVGDDTDPSRLLDAAHTATPDLKAHIRGEAYTEASIDDDDTCVQETESS